MSMSLHFVKELLMEFVDTSRALLSQITMYLLILASVSGLFQEIFVVPSGEFVCFTPETVG